MFGYFSIHYQFVITVSDRLVATARVIIAAWIVAAADHENKGLKSFTSIE